jgi:uncharacterized protein (TIGR02246 family)
VNSVTPTQVQAWLDAYKRAWETRDAALIASIFTQDATYRETPFSAPDEGRGGIRDYWRRNVVGGQRDIAFSCEIWTVEGNVGIAHWRSAFTATSTGERVRLDGIFRLTFEQTQADAVLCRRLEEWWHETKAPAGDSVL